MPVFQHSVTQRSVRQQFLRKRSVVYFSMQAQTPYRRLWHLAVSHKQIEAPILSHNATGKLGRQTWLASATAFRWTDFDQKLINSVRNFLVICLKEFRNNQTTRGKLLHLTLVQMVRYTASRFTCLCRSRYTMKYWSKIHTVPLTEAKYTKK